MTPKGTVGNLIHTESSVLIFSARLVFGACLFLLTALAPSAVLATAYYVSSVRGNDAWNGLYGTYQSGSNGPWKNLSKISNNSSFVAGDKIYLDKGSSWNGYYDIIADGAPGMPITITAYGSGELPLINAGANFYGIRIRGNYITVQYLQFTGVAIPDDMTRPMSEMGAVLVLGDGRRYYTHVAQRTFRLLNDDQTEYLHDITISNCEFNNVKGYEISFNKVKNSVIEYNTIDATGIAKQTKSYHSIVLFNSDHNEVRYNELNHAGPIYTSTGQINGIWNPQISYSGAIYQSWIAADNNHVHHNKIFDSQSSGIMTAGEYNLIEFNNASNNGLVEANSMGPYNGSAIGVIDNNNTLRYNIASGQKWNDKVCPEGWPYNPGQTECGWESVGIYADEIIGDGNEIYGNIIFGNDGACIAITDNKNIKIFNNLCIDNGKKAGSASENRVESGIDFTGSNLHEPYGLVANNIVFNSGTYWHPYSISYNNTNTCTKQLAVPITMKNNIYYKPTYPSGENFARIYAEGSADTILNFSQWKTWSQANLGEQNSMYTNPNFVSNGSIADWSPAAGSPAIDAGLNIDVSQLNFPFTGLLKSKPLNLNDFKYYLDDISLVMPGSNSWEIGAYADDSVATTTTSIRPTTTTTSVRPTTTTTSIRPTTTTTSVRPTSTTTSSTSTTFTLTFRTQGTGGNCVSYSFSPNDSPSGGVRTYASGTVVNITETDAGTCVIDWWSGCDQDSGGYTNGHTCKVTMNKNKTLTANGTDTGY